MNISDPYRTETVTLEGEARQVDEPTSPDDPAALYVLTCLLVGGAVEISDAVLARARRWRAELDAEPKLLPAPGNETGADLLRYALIGLIFAGERSARSQTRRLGRLVLGSVGVAAAAARPLTRSWLTAPLHRPLAALAQRGQLEAARLVQQGRLEEAASRLLAREITNETIDLVLDYLSAKPEVRRLLQQQSMGLADEVVSEVRGRSIAADAFLEKLVRRLLNRAPRTPEPAPEPSRQTE
jgi:hypothetical protein